MTMRAPGLGRGHAVLLLACLVVAACGGTTTTTTGGAAAQTGTTGQGSAGASLAPRPDASAEAATAGQAGASIDVCRVVTAADVLALYPGASVTATVPPSGPTGCSYSFQPEEVGFSMEVVTGDQAATFWAGNISSQGGYSIPLSGIGSRAMRAPGSADLVSISGSTFCEIEPDTQAAELYGGLATPDASDKVPDASATAIA